MFFLPRTLRRMEEKRARRPGDLFIDRYMPNASPEEREQAYENLRNLILVLIEIDDRLARERIERERIAAIQVDSQEGTE